MRSPAPRAQPLGDRGGRYDQPRPAAPKGRPEPVARQHQPAMLPARAPWPATSPKLAVTGLTSNPTILGHAMAASHDYDGSLLAQLRQGLSDP